MPSGHRTLAETVLFLNQVLPMYLLATCHHIPVTCFTTEIVKCTPDARPESPPRSVWPGVRPREGSGSASAVQVTRSESQVMSRKAVAGSQRPHRRERNAPTATRGYERARVGEAGQRGPRSRPAARQLAHLQLDGLLTAFRRRHFPKPARAAGPRGRGGSPTPVFFPLKPHA